jgi:5-formyltetrahydrofolate cyclo-ligase
VTADPAKQALREEVWADLTDAGVARFPGAQGRIPNFEGAADAADRFRRLDVWRKARAVKCNPDAPQWPVRQRALEDGLLVLMAVPRLAAAEPFVLLDPAQLTVSARAASSIKGSGTHGRPAAVDALEPFDLVVSGCVAVDRAGARLGKGGGFADLEFALASAAGLITPETVVATTVHPRQVVERDRIPVTGHDVPVDLIVTPDEVITCDATFPRPDGIQWDDLDDDKIAEIPLLRDLAAGR